MRNTISAYFFRNLLRSGTRSAIALAVLLLASTLHAQSLRLPTLQLTYDSHYITEGRENFGSQGIFAATLEAESSTLTVGFWTGHSDDFNQHEHNLYVADSWHYNDYFNISTSYTYLRFSEGSPDDHEIALSARIGKELGAAIDLSTTYSHQSSGFYQAVYGSYALAHENILTTAHISLGLNNGYISNERSGVDHIAAGVNSSIAISPKIVIDTYLNYTQSINKQFGDTLVNKLWGGITIRLIDSGEAGKL